MDKRAFSAMPQTFTENWPGEIRSFSWEDYLTAIPSPLFLVTTYKENGRENACLQAWSTFVGDAGLFLCILGSVCQKSGHLYPSLMARGGCVLNFPSRDVYGRCKDTIRNNGWGADEITQSGLTAERAKTVDAPRIRECFLNIECELLWAHAHYPGSDYATVALKATHICMDMGRCRGEGRYGEQGYLYNINAARDPLTGAVLGAELGYIQTMEESTK